MRLPSEHGPNWVVLRANDDRTKPALPFAGQAPNWKPAAWDDPDRPQQVHLEVFVRDTGEAAGIVERNGAVRVEEDVWIDPAGHAIRLEPGEPGDAPGVIGHIVLDCSDPRVLAEFYRQLLGMETRVQDTAGRIVIADADRLPMLAFRRVSEHVAPRYPDPEYPQQMHMDITFEDSRRAKRLAEQLGAVRVSDPSGRGHPDIYADPAGHPFCLGFPGQ